MGMTTSNNEETPRKPEKIALKSAEKEAEYLIYIGPNLPNGLLLHGNCFIGGVPEHLQALMAINTSMKALFVPTSKASEALANLQDTTSVETIFSRELMETMRQGGIKDGI